MILRADNSLNWFRMLGQAEVMYVPHEVSPGRSVVPIADITMLHTVESALDLVRHHGVTAMRNEVLPVGMSIATDEVEVMVRDTVYWKALTNRRHELVNRTIEHIYRRLRQVAEWPAPERHAILVELIERAVGLGELDVDDTPDLAQLPSIIRPMHNDLLIAARRVLVDLDPRVHEAAADDCVGCDDDRRPPPAPDEHLEAAYEDHVSGDVVD